jgi:2-oxoacid:acceptor oxidoreductase gamma subunit (pyruvate/2-ketoisovalerate family)
MVEIRFHGRGGQGTVIASKILADALAREEKYVQAFPQFGVERRGAPVYAFIRIDSEPIYVRSKIVHPDHIIVVDPTLIDAIDVSEGLKKGGSILINTSRRPGDFPQLARSFRIFTIDANEIALKYGLGTRAAPIVNTPLLGAVPRVFDFVQLTSIIESIRAGVPQKPDDNAAAASEAYGAVQGV